jgi:hypothetical protein
MDAPTPAPVLPQKQGQKTASAHFLAFLRNRRLVCAVNISILLLIFTVTVARFPFPARCYRNHQPRAFIPGIESAYHSWTDVDRDQDFGQVNTNSTAKARRTSMNYPIPALAAATTPARGRKLSSELGSKSTSGLLTTALGGRGASE